MNVFLFCKITVNKKNLMMNQLRIPTRQSNLTLYQDRYRDFTRRINFQMAALKDAAVV